MIDISLFIYQMLALVFTMIIPFMMLLGLIWLVAKALKGFIRSLSK